MKNQTEFGGVDDFAIVLGRAGLGVEEVMRFLNSGISIEKLLEIAPKRLVRKDAAQEEAIPQDRC